MADSFITIQGGQATERGTGKTARLATEVSGSGDSEIHTLKVAGGTNGGGGGGGGDASAANQLTEINRLESIVTEVGAVNETAPVNDNDSSGLNGRLQRIAQRLSSLIALLLALLGQKTKAESLSVTIASDQEALPLSTGAATEAKQDVTNTEIGAINETAPATDTDPSGLNGRLQRLAQLFTTWINLLPASIGQKNKAGSLAVVLASDSDALPVTAAALPLPSGAATETTLALIKAKTDNIDVALSTRTKPSDNQSVVGTGTFAVQATEADGANVTLGAKADAKSSATDTTPITVMSVLKQISFSIQAAAASLAGTLVVAAHNVTNAGIFAVQATIAAGAATIGKAEDAASANADVGVPAMAIQKGTPADTADTDGDYAMLQMKNGLLYVDGSKVTQPISAASLPLPAGASTEATLALIKAKTDNLDVALSTRTKPADNQSVVGTGTFAVQATEADGANVTLGAKADAKSSASDTTPITVMSVLKQISFSIQAAAASLAGTLVVAAHNVTNAGIFAVQATIAAGAATIGKAEDVASADADVGVPAMAIQKGTPADTAGTDGDYAMLQMKNGLLYTDGSKVTQPISAASLPLPSGASTEATLLLIKAKTDNIDVALSTRTKPADNQSVVGTGTFAVQATEADGANVTLGAKADAKSSASDTTPITVMSVLKQISFSIQAAAASLAGTLVVAAHNVTNAGIFAVQATIAAGAATIGKAEDVASADADVGVPAMAIQKATPADTAGTDGDYAMLQMKNGLLYTDGSKVTQPISAASLPLPSGASTEATLLLIKAKTDNIDVALSTRTKPADNQSVVGTGTFAVQATVADGANVTLGAKADAKSSASDTTAITVMSVLKQISFSIQAAAASLAGTLTVAAHAVTNAGTFAVQATIAAGAATIGKAEDVASADADVGVPAMAIQKATPADTAGTDGDYAMLQMKNGLLFVDGSKVTQPISAASLPLPAGAATESTLDVRTGALTETAPTTDTASSGINGRLQRIAQRITSLIALVPASLGQKTKAASFAVVLASDSDALAVTGPLTDARFDATNGVLPVISKKLAVSTYSPTLFKNLGANATLNIKGSAGNVFSISCYNANAADRYIQLHDTATTPAGGAAPVFSFLVPAGSQINIGTDIFTNEGVNFATGIAFGFSTALNTYVAATAGDQSTWVQYK